MKKIITQVTLLSSVLLLPTMALAKGIELESHASLQITNAPTSVHIEAEQHGGRGRDHAEDDISTNASSTWNTHRDDSRSDSKSSERGRENEVEKHRSATSTASSTDHRGRDNGEHRGEIRGNKLQNFLAWIFGQPGSTTVADLKAQIAASSTISASSTSNTQGLGFFARLFGFWRH